MDIAGGHSATTLSNVTFLRGRAGSGWEFRGDGYIEVPDAPEFNSTELSIELWIQLRSAQDNPIVVKGLRRGSVDYQFAVDPNLDLRFDAINGFLGQGFSVSVPGTALSIGQFHHVAVTVDGSFVRFYIDGVKVGERVQPVALGPNTGRPLVIGSYRPDFHGFFNGVMDELSLYGRSLTDSEIQAIFDAGSAGKCLPPHVTTPSLPLARFGEEYSFVLGVEGDAPPFTLSQIQGVLPAGLTLDPVRRELTGTPAETGVFEVIVRTTNADGRSGFSRVELEVVDAISPLKVPEQFDAGIFARVKRPLAIAHGIAGTPFDRKIFVARGILSHDLGPVDEIVCVLPDGRVGPFAFLNTPDADPASLEFPPTGSPFPASLVFVSANNADFGLPGGRGGSILSVDENGIVGFLTPSSPPTVLGELSITHIFFKKL